MSLADVVRLEVVAAVLVDSHLAGIAAVALPPQAPDAVLTLLAVGHLEPLGHKRMPVDPAHLLPPPSATPVVDPHCRGGEGEGREEREGGRGGREGREGGRGGEGGREGGREGTQCHSNRESYSTGSWLPWDNTVSSEVQNTSHLLSSPLQSLPGAGGMPSNTRGGRNKSNCHDSDTQLS